MTREPALPISKERRRPIPLMSWVFLGTGLLLGFIFAMMAQNNKNATQQFAIVAFVSVVICGILAIPMKDRGVPHQALAYKIRQRRVARQGELSPTPLSRLAKKPPAQITLDQAELVEVRYYGGDGRVKSVPAIRDGNHINFILFTKGLPPDIVTSEGELRFGRQNALTRALQQALESTSLTDIIVVQGLIHRPVNPMAAVAHVQRRADRNIVTAAQRQPNDGEPEVAQVNLGDKMFARIDEGNAVGGENTMYVIVRLPWPTRMGRRIDVADPRRFDMSAAKTILEKTSLALEQHGTSPQLPDWETIHEWWDSATNSSHLAQIYGARYDRFKTGTERTTLVPLRPPTHARVAKSEENNGCLGINGGFVVAGYGDVHTRDALPAGYENLIVLPPDVDYNLATVLRLRRITGRTGERVKGQEAERWQVIRRDLQRSATASEHLSDAEGDAKMRKIIAHREQMVDAGEFTADYWTVLAVWGVIPEEADRGWIQVINGLRSVLLFKLEPNVADGEQLLASTVGLLRE